MEKIKAAELIYHLLEEGKFAEVAAILYSHHKSKLSFWIALKGELLSTAGDSHRLFLIATLLEVSSKKTLEESCHLVPGLSGFISRKKNDY
jgi:hypothetical protein